MVAVVDGDGMVLGTESFSTTRAGYRALLRWMRSFGDLRRVGVEGTGSYGAGITRHLADADVEVLEVDRPDQTDRRRRGKSDTFDAICAAQAALAGRRTSIPGRWSSGRPFASPPPCEKTHRAPPLDTRCLAGF
jgi:transposase